MDIDMPGMTGLDVFEALKADPALAHVPVIFATSHDATALQVTPCARARPISSPSR
jgi:two-component system cell cycle response regulator